MALKNKLTFSVIIPVYNRAAVIARAVESVLAQSRPADEIIVVDDGSVDETASFLNQYLPQIKIIRQENGGVSAARNTGIRAATGEWIALLDSDDEWLPQKLELAMRYIQAHPDCKIFQTEEIWIRNGKRVNPKNKHKKKGGFIYKESLPLCIVSPSAVVIKRSLFDETGLFDETLPVCEDYDLWLRVSRKYKIGLDTQPGIKKYGGHADQLSNKFWGMDRFRIKAMEKQLDDTELHDEMRIWTLREIISKLNILINGYEKRGRDSTELHKKIDKYTRQLSALNRAFVPEAM
jgi:glycosyltransferase involved in cell wall biosynthesis